MDAPTHGRYYFLKLPTTGHSLKINILIFWIFLTDRHKQLFFIRLKSVLSLLRLIPSQIYLSCSSIRITGKPPSCTPPPSPPHHHLPHHLHLHLHLHLHHPHHLPRRWLHAKRSPNTQYTQYLGPIRWSQLQRCALAGVYMSMISHVISRHM